MNCPQCGAQVPDGSLSCPVCGADVQEKKKPNIIGICASVVYGLAVLLPFASALGFSVSLMEGKDGLIVLGIAVLGLVFSFLNNRVGTITAGVLALGYSVLEILQFSDLGEVGALVEKGIGFYVLIIGAIAMLAAGIISKPNR